MCVPFKSLITLIQGGGYAKDTHMENSNNHLFMLFLYYGVCITNARFGAKGRNGK